MPEGLSARPPVNAEISVRGIKVMLFRWDDDYRNIYVEGPKDVIPVRMAPLREKIERKIERYGALCKARNLPLVVAVVASPWTARDPEDFIDVLHGTSGFQHVGYAGSPARPAYKSVRVDDGLFRVAPILSSGIWVEGKSFQKELFDERISGEVAYSPGKPMLPPVPGIERKQSSAWNVLVAYNPRAVNGVYSLGFGEDELSEVDEEKQK
jgi:hypothetical protein